MHRDTSPPAAGVILAGAESNGGDKHRQNELREFIAPRKFLSELQRFAKERCSLRTKRALVGPNPNGTWWLTESASI